MPSRLAVGQVPLSDGLPSQLPRYIKPLLRYPGTCSPPLYFSLPFCAVSSAPQCQYPMPTRLGQTLETGPSCPCYVASETTILRLVAHGAVARLVHLCKLYLVRAFYLRHDFQVLLGHRYSPNQCDYFAWTRNPFELSGITSYTRKASSKILMFANALHVQVCKLPFLFFSHKQDHRFLGGGGVALRTLKGSALKSYLTEDIFLEDFESVDFQFIQCVATADLSSFLENDENLVPFRVPLDILSDFLTRPELQRLGSSHGFKIQVRDNKATLKTMFEGHHCDFCMTYVSVFRACNVISIRKSEARDRQRKCRLEKKGAQPV